MKLVSGLPSGVAAYFFEPARRLRELEAALMAELGAAGFAEAILPVIDDFARYEPLLPPETRAEIHRFPGRDGELLALRSDFTPMVARLLAPHLPALELPLAVSYRGEVVRAGRRDGRRAADLHQVGGELLGADVEGERLEREAARAFARVVGRAAAGRARVVLGLAGALDELLVASAGLAGASDLARAVARRERAASRGAGVALGEIVERGIPSDRGRLGPRGAGALERLESIAGEIAAERPELAVAVDLAEFADYNGLGGVRETRDLRPYYQGLVMRAYLPGHPAPVAGGGRYDRLFHALGAEVAAVGFSLALEPFAAEGGR